MRNCEPAYALSGKFVESAEDEHVDQTGSK